MTHPSDSIQSLETAYTQLLFDALPILSIHGHPTVSGRLITLDANSTHSPVFRPLLPAIPADQADFVKMTEEIIQGVVSDVMEHAKASPDLTIVVQTVRSIREKMALDSVPSHSLRWIPSLHGIPSDQSIYPPVLRRFFSSRGSHSLLLPNIAEQVLLNAHHTEEVFLSLVSELLDTTSSVSIGNLSVERIRRRSLVIVPFYALNVFRGIATWTFETAESAQEASTALNPHVSLNTLNALYSSAVIDVFNAYFMQNISKLTTLGGAIGQKIALNALRYLYPHHALRCGPEAPSPKSTSRILTLHFQNPEVQRFLGFSHAHWELPFTHGSAQSNAPVHQPSTQSYHTLIEVKLQDIAIKAASEMDKQYGRMLSVFGHHSGSLFKASGVFQLWSALGRGDTPEPQQIKLTLDRLLPVWGISQAISLIQKGDTESGLTIPENWIDPRWFDKADIARHVQDAIKTLIIYVWQNTATDAPFLPWIIRCAKEDSPLRWDERSSRPVSALKSLPPFLDDPIMFDKTLAVTIGLFEMLKNLRKYPQKRGWGRSIRRLLQTLPEHDRTVFATLSTTDHSLTLRLSQPVVLDASGEIPSSKSLERIRIFEYQCLRGLVQTDDVILEGHTQSPRIVRVYREWHFRWGELLTLLRSQRG